MIIDVKMFENPWLGNISKGWLLGWSGDWTPLGAEFEISCDQDWKRDEFKEERRSKGLGNYYSYGQFDHDWTHTTLTQFPSGCAWLGLINQMNGLEIIWVTCFKLKRKQTLTLIWSRCPWATSSSTCPKTWHTLSCVRSWRLTSVPGSVPHQVDK